MTSDKNIAIQNKIDQLRMQVKKKPEDYMAWYQLSIILHARGENFEASEILLRLLKKKPEEIEPYKICAKALMQSGQYLNCIEMINSMPAKHMNNVEIQILLATAYQYNNDLVKAEEILKSLSDSPDDRASFALSYYYQKTGRREEAEILLRQGLEKQPDNTDMLNNLGNLLMDKKEFIEAAEYFIKALRIEPRKASYLQSIATCFAQIGKTDLAIKFLDDGLNLEPDNGMLICAKASLLCTIGMSAEALPEYERGLSFLSKNTMIQDAEYTLHFSNYVFYSHYAPGVPREKLFERVKQWQKNICKELLEKESTEFNNTPAKNKKLKLGLISAGFSTHPVGQMIIAALKHLNQNEYEFIIYVDSMARNGDLIYQSINELAQKNHNIHFKPNNEVCQTIRNDEIDIMIEMTGHSDGGKRLPLIAHRMAPVQVKWVGGLFNTSGVPQMDWLITDNVETPEGDEKWYTEKLYRMPDDYIVYYPPPYAPKVAELPASKKGFITFGNLNNLAKTNSYSIELWSKILHAVPKSKLLLKGSKMDAGFVQDHILKAFAGHGISHDRIILEGGEHHQKFLNVYNRIDIALDPHPYTGGLTTCEALWMGVPVVTLPGDTFAGRHAATHLTNAGMPEWIAKDEQDYIDIAVKWANDLDGLAKLRAGMREHVSKTPLVDGPRFAKNLEIALRHMWSEWCDAKEAANKPKEVSKPKPKKSKKRK